MATASIARAAAPQAEPAPQVGSVSHPVREDPRPPWQSPSTRAMAARLAAIYRATDWRLDPSKAALRVLYYKALLQKPLTPDDEATVRFQLAKEQLSAGSNADAVATLLKLRADASAGRRAPDSGFSHRLGAALALAYLRLSAQQNCFTPPPTPEVQPESALFTGLCPARRHPEPARNAAHELEALLTEEPNDPLSRWLLSLAAMQLGLYPQGVPKRWLLAPGLFRSDAPSPHFPDIAAQAGVDIFGQAGGVLMEDFDGDGWLDLMVSSSGPLDQMHLFHNNGDGTFTDVTAAAGLLGEMGGLNLVETDYNNDGHPDVLVLRGGWWAKQGRYPMSLLRNNGDGAFTDVTVAAGLYYPAPTQTAAWADFDGDGWLDLFVGRESTPGNPEPSSLYRNNHHGAFTDIAAASGLSDMGFVKGVAWGDYNNDGRPDLYISVLGGQNHLLRNDGPAPGAIASRSWRFTDVTAQAGVAGPVGSFATWFFDYDNDGWPDLFVAGYSADSMRDVGAFESGEPSKATPSRLYHNNHDGTFTDRAEQTGLNRAILSMGANFGDLDNDGQLGVYLGTGSSEYRAMLPNRMFRNADGKRFEDITTDGGFGNLQKGHGIAFGDLENTGFEDVFEVMGGAQPGDGFRSVLYRNPGNGNHSLTLELQGVQTNRAAFGAHIDVAIREAGRLRHIHRTVGYGSSFGGNPLRQYIGLGVAKEADSITVRWPVSKTTQHFQHITAGRTYRIVEGAAALKTSKIGPALLPPAARP